MMGLEEDILIQSSFFGIDPYAHPFKPADLKLKASDYGSFSDYCSSQETVSGKHNTKVILKVAEWRKGKPFKYIMKR